MDDEKEDDDGDGGPDGSRLPNALERLRDALNEVEDAIADAENMDWEKVLDFKVDLRGLNDTRYNVSMMTPAEQIERLATQRNILLKLVERISYGFPDEDPFAEALYKMAHEIVGNDYVIEGINAETKEVYEVVPWEASAPYVAAAKRS